MVFTSSFRFLGFGFGFGLFPVLPVGQQVF